MRKSFWGLCGMVTNIMEKNPSSGDVFVFFNKRRNMFKLLWYQGSLDSKGFSILMHRLDSGTYHRKLHTDSEFPARSVSLPELACILEQITKVTRER